MAWQLAWNERPIIGAVQFGCCFEASVQLPANGPTVQLKYSSHSFAGLLVGEVSSSSCRLQGSSTKLADKLRQYDRCSTVLATMCCTIASPFVSSFWPAKWLEQAIVHVEDTVLSVQSLLLPSLSLCVRDRERELLPFSKPGQLVKSSSKG